MKKSVELFFGEVEDFSRKNWWIYVIYVIIISLVFIDGQNIAPIIITTTLHFVADVFIMMMLSSYAAGEYKVGTQYQIISALIFTSVKIYTGIISNAWYFLAADPIYFLSAIKAYYKDAKGKTLSFINYISLSVASVLIVSFGLIPAHAITQPAEMILTTGIFLFAIALSIYQGQFRVTTSIIALAMMVVGAGWATFESFETRKFIGLAISYTLLPLTVLIFYLKTIIPTPKPI